LEEFKEYLAVKRLLPDEMWHMYTLRKSEVKDLVEVRMMKEAKRKLKDKLTLVKRKDRDERKKAKAATKRVRSKKARKPSTKNDS